MSVRRHTGGLPYAVTTWVVPVLWLHGGLKNPRVSLWASSRVSISHRAFQRKEGKRLSDLFVESLEWEKAPTGFKAVEQDQ